MESPSNAAHDTFLLALANPVVPKHYGISTDAH